MLESRKMVVSWESWFPVTLFYHLERQKGETRVSYLHDHQFKYISVQLPGDAIGIYMGYGPYVNQSEHIGSLFLPRSGRNNASSTYNITFAMSGFDGYQLLQVIAQSNAR
jgi:hypothetical protein